MLLYQYNNLLLLTHDKHLLVHGIIRWGWVLHSEHLFNFPESFWADWITHQYKLLSLTDKCSIFYDVGVALDLIWEK